MFGMITGLLSDALAPLFATIASASARLLRKVALFLVAGLCLVVVMIAVTLAFDFWIATLAGPIVAALAVAGGYLVVAIIAVFLALRDGSPAPVKTETARAAAGVKTRSTDAKSSGAKPSGAKSSASHPEINAQIDQFTAPILDLLQRFGLRREQLAVFAGASVAKRLGPLPLVGCAIIAGFLVGRLWKSWRHIFEAALAASPLIADLLGQKPTDAASKAEV